MTFEQMKLTGIWANLVDVRKNLMDVQNEIAQMLSTLEMLEQITEEVENG